jgi:LytS/YehU family sensor histidine kinase
VLENSRLEAIPLRKELTLLENYLQLQKLRFETEFDYTINVDESIDTDGTFIPPMLAQPFIENALEHGLNGATRGLIEINFRVEKDHLLLEIKDNGLGIVPGNPGIKGHSSLATVITKERIELMNKKSKTAIVFAIGDAYPGQENKGVRVSFNIPLEAVAA